MGTADLKQGTFDVHQVTGESTQVNTAYGVVTVPNGHYIVNFPGDFEYAVPLPPEAFSEMFEAMFEAPAPAPEEAPVEAPAEPAPAPEAPVDLPPPPVPPELAAPPIKTPPTEEEIAAWVAGHYVETYRPAVMAKLMANPARAQELIDKYPLPETVGQAPLTEQI